MKMDGNFNLDVKALRELPNKGRVILFETLYGSELYGCAIEGSDRDIRGVYMPGLYDFVRETKEETSALVPQGDFGFSDDIAYFPVGMFVDQVMRMKTNCTEIFFAALQERANGATLHPAMNLILDAKDDLISADIAGFTGHAKQRASAYVEGDDPMDMTLQANKHVLAVLTEAAAQSEEAPALRLADVPGLTEALTAHEGVTSKVNKGGDFVFLINGKQMSGRESIAVAKKSTEQRLERFQKKDFEAAPEVMFKDLATALRMMETAASLMETGTITYPLVRADYYRRVRFGEVSRKCLVEEIKDAHLRAEAAVKTGRSPLRPAYKNDEHLLFRDQLVAQLRYMALKELDL